MKKAGPGSRKAVILTVQENGYEDILREAHTDKIFSYTNHVLEFLGPIAEESGGMIDGFYGAGLTVFYEQKPEQALCTALKICESGMHNYTIGISYGNVLWGEIGYGKHKTRLTLSEDKKISAILQKMTTKYYAGILVTASYTKQLSEFESRYAHRFLGFLKTETDLNGEKIIDVFSADVRERQWMKRKTRMVFEEGVRLYLTGKDAQARKHFIEVLKIDREDNAARIYLSLCDEIGKQSRYLV